MCECPICLESDPGKIVWEVLPCCEKQMCAECLKNNRSGACPFCREPLPKDQSKFKTPLDQIRFDPDRSHELELDPALVQDIQEDFFDEIALALETERVARVMQLLHPTPLEHLLLRRSLFHPFTRLGSIRRTAPQSFFQFIG